jgi:hypothetical protein
MRELIEVLQRFDRRYPRRARGGLYALAGFDFQLRAYLADFAQRLASANHVHAAGQQFLEAFSDFVREEASDTVCVQVKRTLNPASMAQAALEFVLIDEFLEEEAPHLQNRVSFEVLSQYSDVASPSVSCWSDIELPIGAEDRDRRQARLETLRSRGRLLAPRVEPDPWWRLVAAVFPVLDDPFAFAHEALDICMGRGIEPGDAERVRDEIVQAFAKRRKALPTFPGEVMTEDKFEPIAVTTRQVLLGEIPTVAHLRDGRSMERLDRLGEAMEALDRYLAEWEWRREPQIYTFWVDGRSGNGKSLLLLQLMRALVVARKSRVVWLDDASEGLLPLLRAWAASPNMGGAPWFVFVDDFNAPHKRESIDFDAMARLVRHHAGMTWPILITCGPPEQHAELRSSGHDEAFRLETWRLPPADVTERDALRTWFKDRTGEDPKTGNAFEQDEGLMISMVFELRQGDLGRFGHRFRSRLESEGLVEALALPLALNRLYIWAPSNWLNEEQADALRRINHDRDFSILSADYRVGGYVRLTHPHLSDAIYRAIRSKGDEIVLARDLAKAFARAVETDSAVAARILGRIAESHDRLEILDPRELAKEVTAAWTSWPSVETRFTADELATIWTYWARWTARQAEVATFLGGAPPLERARSALPVNHRHWGILWCHLWDCEPGHAGLAADAGVWLEREWRNRNRNWSRVWERLFKRARSFSVSATADLVDLAVRWLRDNEFEPDWNYVFRQLAVAYHDSAPWDSALRLVDQFPANRNWAYGFEVVADAGTRFSKGRRETTASAASRWLAAAEGTDTAEWAFVWRKLLDCRDDLPEGVETTQLLQLGLDWLGGREDRAEWAFVWRKLLDCRGDLPEGVGATQLLQLGLDWLGGREDREEWAFAWQKLLDCRDDLPEGVEAAQLLQLGLDWLGGRQDREEWAFAWQKLLDCRDDLPEGVEAAQLLQLGLDWLGGRDDRAEWNFVWQKLLDCRDDLPEGVEATQLLQLGLDWLGSREDREEWTFVWQKLLDCRGDLPEGVEAAQLLRVGLDWLEGREGRAGWTFVWQNLLDCRDDLPEGVGAIGLLQLGWGWLSPKENRSRGEWDKLYEACLRCGFREPEFLEAGVQWVIANGSLPQAYGIAQQILMAFSSLTESHPLVAWAREWLRMHPGHSSWTYVWEALWGACSAVSTAELALPWLQWSPKEGAIFYVARTLAATRRQEIIDLMLGWCRSHPEEPWVSAVQDGMAKGMK